MTKIKICGMREHQNVMDLSELKPDWMGFIFYEKSPRYFFNAKEPVKMEMLKRTTNRVGVFVNETSERILEVHAKFELDFVQLHGNEHPEQCRELADQGLKLIKAIPVAAENDLEGMDAYAPYVSYFLFDTKGAFHGGNGTRFDWNLLKTRRFSKPFLLSGGVSPADADELNAFDHPDFEGVDINSKFEETPGKKNLLLVKTFMQRIS
jgi:phosphoribosylanthranilate isomerase